MPGPFDKASMTKEDHEGFADILSKHGVGSVEHQVADPPGGIFEDFVFGEIRWNPADHPNVADSAKAFTIAAGTVKYVGIDTNGAEIYVDAPVYHASWWARTDDNGHPFVTFIIGNVYEGKTFVLVEFAAGSGWTSTGGQGSNLKIVQSRRGFTKTKGAQFLQFEVIRD